ncbi:hypothetical protein MAPG_10459 [Magnaporthiopsis poae ATCC 64411]|uniref:Uncharacterized protein n=1 Tax=Magnaporthiopsis poae (strain ATCC 64411 / 73-15) TaxID=644358 RepID=A0A0C4ECM8_MAGP6|nr:hypothetical protein MAPG_10459 [Magnaporthiopsis poae ATCC 64411]
MDDVGAHNGFEQGRSDRPLAEYLRGPTAVPTARTLDIYQCDVRDLAIGVKGKLLDFAYFFQEYKVAQLHTLDGLVSEVSGERHQGVDCLNTLLVCKEAYTKKYGSVDEPVGKISFFGRTVKKKASPSSVGSRWRAGDNAIERRRGIRSPSLTVAPGAHLAGRPPGNLGEVGLTLSRS